MGREKEVENEMKPWSHQSKRDREMILGYDETMDAKMRSIMSVYIVTEAIWDVCREVSQLRADVDCKGTLSFISCS